jgi:hypothetical protein
MAAGANQVCRVLPAAMPAIVGPPGVLYCRAIPIGVNANAPQPDVSLVFAIDPANPLNLLACNMSSATWTTGNGTSWAYSFCVRI